MRGLRPDARNAGNVVGGIACQPQDVDHLFNFFDVPLFENFRHIQQFAGAAHAGLEHEGVFVDELGIVLVGGDHVGVEALLLRRAGEGSDHVVGLEAGIFEYGNVEGIEQVFNMRDGGADSFRGFVARGLVFGIFHMPEGWAVGIECHRDMRRLVGMHDIE